MQNLIQKAIEAIQAGKNDYAVGLLEGLLAMTNDAKVPIAKIGIEPPGLNYRVATQTLSPKQPELNDNDIDPMVALESGVAGKISALKASSITT